MAIGSKPPSSTDSKDVTPDKWSGPKDARQNKGAGVYPNFFSHKTRSGHVLMMDDSEDNESITLQHRGGSMVQFMPDGAVQFVSHNGQYNFVFGENRVHITGAYDVTVLGGGSLRVDGDYNCTVQGNHNTTVTGDMNITAKNMNTVVRGNMDTSAKNMTTKIEGSTEIATEGITTFTSDKGIAMASSGESVSILGKKNVGIGSGEKIMLEAGTSMDFRSEDNLAMEAKAGKMDIKSADQLSMSTASNFTLKGSGVLALDGGPYIKMNEGIAQEADGARKVSIVLPVTTNPNRES